MLSSSLEYVCANVTECARSVKVSHLRAARGPPDRMSARCAKKRGSNRRSVCVLGRFKCDPPLELSRSVHTSSSLYTYVSAHALEGSFAHDPARSMSAERSLHYAIARRCDSFFFLGRKLRGWPRDNESCQSESVDASTHILFRSSEPIFCLLGPNGNWRNEERGERQENNL